MSSGDAAFLPVRRPQSLLALVSWQRRPPVLPAHSGAASLAVWCFLLVCWCFLLCFDFMSFLKGENSISVSMTLSSEPHAH